METGAIKILDDIAKYSRCREEAKFLALLLLQVLLVGLKVAPTDEEFRQVSRAYMRVKGFIIFNGSIPPLCN